MACPPFPVSSLFSSFGSRNETFPGENETFDFVLQCIYNYVCVMIVCV